MGHLALLGRGAQTCFHHQRATQSHRRFHLARPRHGASLVDQRRPATASAQDQRDVATKGDEGDLAARLARLRQENEELSRLLSQMDAGGRSEGEISASRPAGEG